GAGRGGPHFRRRAAQPVHPRVPPAATPRGEGDVLRGARADAGKAVAVESRGPGAPGGDPGGGLTRTPRTRPLPRKPARVSGAATMRRGSRRADEALARTAAPIHPRRAAGRAPRPVTAPPAHRPLRPDDLGRPAVPGCRARGNRLALVHALDFTRPAGAPFGARSPRQPPRPRTAPRTPGHLFLLPQRRLR